MTPEELAEETRTGDDKIVEVAKARFQRCRDWEGTAQARWQIDMKFAHADPDNGWQWPGYLWSQRKDDPEGYKPRLTVNKVRQHNLHITNDQKQNKPGIHIRPVGEDATFDAAKIWEGLVRHIERISKATQAYGTAGEHQVNGGIGYIRVVTEYIEETFDQEIFIRRVKNPLNIYMDPDHNEIDGSDSSFAFVFDQIPVVEYYKKHPEMRGQATNMTFGMTPNWLGDEHVMELEYFDKVKRRDTLVLMKNPDGGDMVVARWSKIPAQIRKFIEPNDILRRRPIEDDEIKWYKIAGDHIVERGKWPGKYIPIVPIIGEETIIDNQLDRKGHTRALKDAQRMYNFWTSNAVEQVALQTKSRWFVPVGATDNLDQYYRMFNRQNYPLIPWNAFDADGNQLPSPIAIEPPTMADAYIKGMMISQNELMMASGQREENMGEQTNAISGKAIDARQRQGDNATYHYIDGLAIGVRQVGNIILDVAPHIYTSRQIKMILAEDGSEQLIRIDPSADVGYAESKEDEQTWVVFNPKVGRYWVDSDIGPSYATKRQEAWNAFVQITTANQQLVGVIGDLMFRNADFPGAAEIAERLKRMVPPNILGEGPEPALVQAQQQNQSLQSLLAEMTEKLAKQELQLQDKEGKLLVDQQNADTARLRELGNAEGNLGEERLMPLIQKLIADALAEVKPSAAGEPGADELAQAEQAAAASPAASPPAAPNGAGGPPVPGGPENAPTAPPGAGAGPSGEVPPVHGARMAPDGNHYVPDTRRPGKYLRVEQG